MVGPVLNPAEEFEQLFILSEHVRGKQVKSLDEVLSTLNQNYGSNPFKKPRLQKPMEIRDDNVTVEPFKYLVVDFGGKNISSPMHVGYKLDSEKFFRLGSPYTSIGTESRGATAHQSKALQMFADPEMKVKIGYTFL